MEFLNLYSIVHFTWFRYFTMKLFKVGLEVMLILEIKIWIPVPILDWHAHWIHLLQIQRGRWIQWVVCQLVTTSGTEHVCSWSDQQQTCPGQKN